MKKDNQPILIIDSGLGGINIATKLHELCPQEDVICLADLLHVPYSEQNIKTINHSINHFIKAINYYQPKMVIIACNTLDALGGDKIDASCPQTTLMRIINTCAKTVKAVCVNKEIAVFATPHTIEAQAYALAIGLYVDQANIYGISCEHLAGLIEAQDFKNPEMKDEIQLASELGCDTIVLGCTHYSLVKHMFQKAYPQASIVDSSDCVLQASINKLKILNLDYTLPKTGDFKVIVNHLCNEQLAIIKNITTDDVMIVSANEDFICE